MKYEVKNRFTGIVQFTTEINCDESESDPIKLGLAVKWGLENKSNLSGADLRGAHLYGANLSGADLSHANLSGADLVYANLGDANLHGAYLYGTNLGGADLSHANLSGANLRDANLGDANLRDADLRGASLGGADLVYANLISGGQRSDGYEFYGQIKDGELWIKAGCRYFSIDEARRHWNETRKDTTLGDETFLRLNMIESIAKTRFGDF